MPGFQEQSLERRHICRKYEGLQFLTDESLLRNTQHVGEASVAVQHCAILSERDGSFLDLLD